MADLTKTLKDAAYITIGFGVLAFQKAQVRRREFEAQLATQASAVKAQTAGLRDELTKIVKDVEARFEPVVDQIESSLDQLEERLPTQAKDAFKQARTAAKDAQAQLRTRLGVAEATVAA